MHSDCPEQCLLCSPTLPLPPIKDFYFLSQSQKKSMPVSPPLHKASSCTVSSLQQCSLLLQSQHNHGWLDLSMYFSPIDHASGLNMVSHGTSCPFIICLTGMVAPLISLSLYPFCHFATFSQLETNLSKSLMLTIWLYQPFIMITQNCQPCLTWKLSMQG